MTATMLAGLFFTMLALVVLLLFPEKAKATGLLFLLVLIEAINLGLK